MVPVLPSLVQGAVRQFKLNCTYLSTVAAGAGAASDLGFMLAKNIEKLAPLAGEIRCAVWAFFLQ